MPPGERSSSRAATVAKPVALAFVTEEVDAWYAWLVSQGVKMRSELRDSTSLPIRGFTAYDPEGYTLEFETCGSAWRARAVPAASRSSASASASRPCRRRSSPRSVSAGAGRPPAPLQCQHLAHDLLGAIGIVQPLVREAERDLDPDNRLARYPLEVRQGLAVVATAR
jgi:hypothetical protein